MAKSEILGTLKFRRLQRRLPTTSKPLLLGLLELMWITAWESGVVAFASDDDVEIAAEWDGAPGEFAGALRDERWLDETDLGLEIHDWWVHAPDYVRRRKAMLQVAIARGYEGIPDAWLSARNLTASGDSASGDKRTPGGPPVVPKRSTGGIRPVSRRSTGGVPQEDRRGTNGTPPVNHRTPRPNPTQPNPTQTQPDPEQEPPSATSSPIPPGGSTAASTADETPPGGEAGGDPSAYPWSEADEAAFGDAEHPDPLWPAFVAGHLAHAIEPGTRFADWRQETGAATGGASESPPPENPAPPAAAEAGSEGPAAVYPDVCAVCGKRKPLAGGMRCKQCRDRDVAVPQERMAAAMRELAERRCAAAGG